nr:MAG TPA: hypothetical protein [Caudoviricetes sp.]
MCKSNIACTNGDNSLFFISYFIILVSSNIAVEPYTRIELVLTPSKANNFLAIL